MKVIGFLFVGSQEISMRKGITPVVAVILLMSITVGAGATLWQVYQDYMPKENPDTSIVDVTSLDIESCWKQGSPTHTFLSIRNENTNAINSSKINVFVNGSLQNNYQYSRQIVDPQETFRLEIYKDLDSSALIMLSTGSSQIKYRC